MQQTSRQDFTTILLTYLGFLAMGVFVGLTLVGFSLAPIYPVMTSATPRRVGIEHAANAVGFQVAGAGAGLSVMPAFAGVLAQQINLEIILPIVFFAHILMFALFQLSLSYSGRKTSTIPAAEGI